MKKVMVGILTLLLMLNINATVMNNYLDTIKSANDYIEKFKKYKSYIVVDESIKFKNTNGTLGIDSNFKKGGLLNLYEFNVSKINGKTYLFNGQKYWTMTENGSSNYAVTSYLTELKSKTEKYGTRVTEYVKPKTVVTGIGSYSDPWEFVYDKTRPVLAGGTMSTTKVYNNESLNKNLIESITFVTNINVPPNAIDSWDASLDKNESVIAWYTDIDNNNLYELYIGAENQKVIAPVDSSKLFYRFENAKSIDVRDLETFQTKYMGQMFSMLGYNSTSLIINGLSNFDLSNVENAVGMFYNIGYNATTWSIGDLSNWNVSNVINMDSMFYGAGYSATTWDIGNLNNWDVNNATNMNNMFQFAGENATTWSIGNLSNWNVGNVTDMSGMFSWAGSNATTWDIGNLSNWNVSKVTKMDYMFQYAGKNAITWNIGNLSNWDVGNVVYMMDMFEGAGENATTWNIGNLSNWNVSKVTEMSNMFSLAGKNATTWNIGNLSNWNTEKVINMIGMFRECPKADIGSLKIYAGDIKGIFRQSQVTAIINIYGNPTNYDEAFLDAATISGSEIKVNYSSETTNIDAIIATKSDTSNVIKGNRLD